MRGHHSESATQRRRVRVFTPAVDAFQALLAMVHRLQPRTVSPESLPAAVPASPSVPGEIERRGPSLPHLAQLAHALTGARGAAIALSSGDKIVCVARSGDAPGIGVELNRSQGLSGECLRTGEAQVCADTRTDSRVDRAACEKMSVRSAAILPLHVQGRVSGLLAAFSDRPGYFDEGTLEVLSDLQERLLERISHSAPNPEASATAPATPTALATPAVPASATAPPTPAAPAAAASAEPAEKREPAPVPAQLKAISPPPPATAPPTPTAPAAPASAQPAEKRDSAPVPGQPAAISPPPTAALPEMWRDQGASRAVPPAAIKPAPASVEPAKSNVAPQPVQFRFLEEASRPPAGANVLRWIMGLALVLVLGALGWQYRFALVSRPKAPDASAVPAAPPAAAPSSQPSMIGSPLDASPAGSQAAPDEPKIVPPTLPENIPVSNTPARNATTQARSALAQLLGVEQSATADASLVTIRLDRETQYQAHALHNPERIYIDLRATQPVSNVSSRILSENDSRLHAVRVWGAQSNSTRVVLDLKAPAGFSIHYQPDPPRLVIEVRSPKAALASPFFPKAGPVLAERQPVRKTYPRDQRLETASGIRIVLDPGHGGDDRGTVGRAGLEEKQLVLDVAQRLGKMLQTGMSAQVILTREDDRFLPLEERTAIANQAQADLFISIHANSSPDHVARGVETYYLGNDAEGAQVAARENTGGGSKGRVQNIGSRALQQQTETRTLAEQVQQSLYSELGRNGSMQNRGVKTAPLVVLRGAEMPAILTEISFVTTPGEERKLQSRAYRQKIAEALYRGIARHLATERAPHSTRAGLP